MNDIHYYKLTKRSIKKIVKLEESFEFDRWFTEPTSECRHEICANYLVVNFIWIQRGNNKI